MWCLDEFEYEEFNKDFPYSVFNQKYVFWANLIQKIKTVTLSWKLEPG